MAATPETMTLASDAVEVVLLPAVGGRIHRIRAFGHDLLRTPPDPASHRSDPFFWGAYPMAPWCNRARPGRSVVAGRQVDLEPNFDDGSAIHGLVSSVPWRVTGPGTLEVAVDGPRWPWAFGVRLEVAVDAEIVRLGYRLENRSDAPMPAGLGLHPWFRAPVEVRLPAASVYPANTDSAVRPRPVQDRFDLRSGGPPSPGMDATWGELAEPSLELTWPATAVTARLGMTTSAPGILVALASPSDMGAVAVEPQTHGPDPLRRLDAGEPDAPILLPPGAVLALDLRLEVALARNLR
jgi:aldose 1-epimerase